MSGHWYCHKCVEVVFRHGAETGLQFCPQCRTRNAVFIVHTETPKQKTLNAELAALLFANMKKAIQ